MTRAKTFERCGRGQARIAGEQFMQKGRARAPVADDEDGVRSPCVRSGAHKKRWMKLRAEFISARAPPRRRCGCGRRTAKPQSGSWPAGPNQVGASMPFQSGKPTTDSVSIGSFASTIARQRSGRTLARDTPPLTNGDAKFARNQALAMQQAQARARRAILKPRRKSAAPCSSARRRMSTRFHAGNDRRRIQRYEEAAGLLGKP